MYRLAALALSAWLVGCGGGSAKPPPAPPPRAVQVLKLAPSDHRETGEYLGSLLSRGSVAVAAQANGYVRVVSVKPGQKVAKGDPLVEIDARAETAALNSASAQAQSARTTLALAKKSASRAEALFKDGLISVQEIEKARADVASA